MKNLKLVFPVFAVVAVLGGAIYYVRANAPVRPEQLETAKVQPAAQTLVPPSDRYAAASAAVH
jgi:hypothetical protein